MAGEELIVMMMLTTAHSLLAEMVNVLTLLMTLIVIFVWRSMWQTLDVLGAKQQDSRWKGVKLLRHNPVQL